MWVGIDSDCRQKVSLVYIETAYPILRVPDWLLRFFGDFKPCYTAEMHFKM